VAGTCEHGVGQNAGNFLPTRTTSSSRTLMPADVYVYLSLAYEVAL